MLLHFVEHFIYGVYPEATSKTAELLNQSVWDALFFIFAGKSYTVFALLFGFTCIVQQRNQEAKGSDLDGTLLQYGKKELEGEIFDQIRALHDQGILFCPASGRQYTSLRKLFAPVADCILFIDQTVHRSCQ